MNWLRVELLRLRSFDNGRGTIEIRFLKDGVAKLSSTSLIKNLTRDIGLSEDEILSVIDSPSVINEIEGKSFTIAWREGCLVLSWMEEGISQIKSDISQDYYEENGVCYCRSRWTQRLVYLDGTERIYFDTGEEQPRIISKEEFIKAVERTRIRGDAHPK